MACRGTDFFYMSFGREVFKLFLPVKSPTTLLGVAFYFLFLKRNNRGDGHRPVNIPPKKIG